MGRRSPAAPKTDRRGKEKKPAATGKPKRISAAGVGAGGGGANKSKGVQLEQGKHRAKEQ